jgi:prolyl-tRNA synthetase
VQVVIIPIVKKGADSAVSDAAAAMAASLKAAGVRCKVDAGTEKTPGWKFNHYEMRGVPVRVEVRRSCVRVEGMG